MSVCTLTIQGVSYDVSKFMDRHPGGDTIKSFVGRDATHMFYAMHPPNSHAYKVLATLPIVSCDRSQMEYDDFMAMYDIAKKLVSNKRRTYRYFAREFAIMMSIYASACFCLFMSKMAAPASSCMFALAFLHGTYMSHHIVHKQLLIERGPLRDMLQGLVAAGFTGYSPWWWMDKHNLKHHAHTNVAYIDTDIAMQHIRFDRKIHGEEKWYMKYQHYYIWILLVFLGSFGSSTASDMLLRTNITGRWPR